MKFAWLCSHESYQPEDLVKQAKRPRKPASTPCSAATTSTRGLTTPPRRASSGLGAVAVQTRSVLLGTSVTCPLFH